MGIIIIGYKWYKFNIYSESNIVKILDVNYNLLKKIEVKFNSELENIIKKRDKNLINFFENILEKF